MLIEFSSDELDKAETDARFRPPFAAGVLKAYRKQLNSLHSATDERDLRANKGLNFEKHRSLPGHHTVRLNDQYRVLVRLEGEAPHKTLVIVAITDHHDKKVL